MGQCGDFPKLSIQSNIEGVLFILPCFCPRSAGVAAVKDSVPLSPPKPSATSAHTEQQGSKRGNPALGKDLQSPHVTMETANLQPHTPKAEDQAEEDNEAGGPLTISELVYRSVQVQSTLFSSQYSQIDGN